MVFSFEKNSFILMGSHEKKNDFVKIFKNLDTDLKVILFGPLK